MMHMNEIRKLEETFDGATSNEQSTIYTALDETYKLKTEVDNMRAEVKKQKEIVKELKKCVNLYEVALTEKDKYICDLQTTVNEKNKLINTEFDNYDKLIMDHVDMEKKLISDVEKSTVYVRSFIVAVMMIAASALFFV